VNGLPREASCRAARCRAFSRHEALAKRAIGLCLVLFASLPVAPAAWSQQPAGTAAAPVAPRGSPGSPGSPGSDVQPLTAQPLPPAASGRGNDVFRSVDENGTPSFSQVPPSGRASKPVELKPLSGSIDSARPVLPTQAPSRAPTVPTAPAPPAVPTPAAGTEPAPRASGPRGLPFETYILIRRGMSEGELLGRAGPPDYRGNEINRGLVQESWYYLPTATDPFTTIIQMRGGRVVDTERIRKL
jgi:hypothetical protein